MCTTAFMCSGQTRKTLSYFQDKIFLVSSPMGNGQMSALHFDLV